MKGEDGRVKIDLKVGDSYMGMFELTEDFMVLTVNEDNTLTLSTMGTTVKGSWTEESGKYYFTIEGEKQEIKVSGSKLTMKEDGSELVLKK